MSRRADERDPGAERVLRDFEARRHAKHDRGGNGRSADDASPDDVATPADLTENALAHEFTRHHRDELRYVHEWGQWLRWDKARWADERTLAVFDLARHVTHEAGAGIENDGHGPASRRPPPSRQS